jgi:hypothetical protein
MFSVADREAIDCRLTGPQAGDATPRPGIPERVEIPDTQSYMYRLQTVAYNVD